MASTKQRIVRQLILELSGIIVGLATTMTAMFYLDWYLWPGLAAAVMLAGMLSFGSWRRAQAVLKSPRITITELRRRGGLR